MARPLCPIRVMAMSIAAVAIVHAAPAAAQFFNPFEALFGPPPRPPSSVPASLPPTSYPQYPDPRYEQRYPGPQNQVVVPRQGPPVGVQSEPLPPPPGATAAIPSDPGQPPRATPLPANTSPQDEVSAEAPAQKVENKSALFTGLDKITGRTINFDVAIGETVQFGALQVTPRACYTRAPTETPNTDAFIDVDEVTLPGEVKRIFTGWMFASSPGLHAVEHPIYDVWLTDCKNPVVASVAPPEAPPPAAAPAPAPAKPAATRRSSNQPPRPAPQGIFPR
jgi:hypothetical protein